MKEELLEEIRELLSSHEKIQAIKIYKENAGTSLKKAKEVIDSLEEEMLASGEIPATLEEEKTKIPWTSFFSPWFLIIALGLIIYGTLKLMAVI